MNKKVKILILSFSYLFFTFILFISFNAVIPDQDLPIIQTKKPMIKKIKNEFIDDKNSIYEILKEDSKIKNRRIDDNSLKLNYGKEEKHL